MPACSSLLFDNTGQEKNIFNVPSRIHQGLSYGTGALMDFLGNILLCRAGVDTAYTNLVESECKILNSENRSAEKDAAVLTL